MKLYLEDHVFQKDIAKTYKISTALVSKLVREAQAESTRNQELKQKEEDEQAKVQAIKQTIDDMLTNEIPITKADLIV